MLITLVFFLKFVANVLLVWLLLTTLSTFASETAPPPAAAGLLMFDNIGHCVDWKPTQARETCQQTPACMNSSSPTRNLIIIYEPFGAGIKDRSNVVHRALQVGASMCASVLIPPPYMMLSHFHNQAPIDCNWSWSRYWDTNRYYPRLFTWFEDNTPFSKQLYYEPIPQPSGQCSDPMQCTPSPTCRNKTSTFQELLWSVEKTGYKVVNNIEDSLDMYIDGIPFALPIIASSMFNKPFRNSCLPLLEKLGGRASDNVQWPCPSLPPLETLQAQDLNRCDDCPRMLASQLVNSIASEIVQDLGSNFVLLHMRRGDTLRNVGIIDKCDNSPTQLKALLSCMQKRSPVLLSNEASIAFATDDRDPVYLREVRAVLRGYAKKVVHFDQLVKTRILLSGHEPDDNYLVYQVFTQIKSFMARDAVVEFGGHSRNAGAACRELTQCIDD